MNTVYAYDKKMLGFCVNCRDKILELLKESTIIPRLVVGKQGKECDLLVNHYFSTVQRCELLMKRTILGSQGNSVVSVLKLTNDARRTLIKEIKRSCIDFTGSQEISKS